MALSVRTKRILEVSMADRIASAELAAAIDSGSNPQAGAVAVFGATVDLTALVVAPTVIADSAMVAVIPAEPTSAEVDTAIDTLRTAAVSALNAKADNADVETLRGEVETRLDNIETKINAVITALKNAGLMA